MAAPHSPEPSRGRVAGIDYGTVRIGIAISDPDRTIASPVESYVRRDERRDAERFRRLVEEEGVTLFVVGLPVHLDGRESRQSLGAREFARWLRETTSVPVELFDERFTTAEARRKLGEAEISHKGRKRRVDKVAAQILLAAFLESHSRGQADPGPLDDA